MLRTQLIVVADAYAAARNRSRSRVSTVVLSSGRALDRIAEGGDLTTGSWEKAMDWFHRNWPEDVQWPHVVPRSGAQ